MAAAALALDFSLSLIKAESSVNLITKFINWLSSSSEIRFEFYGENYSSEKVLEGILYSEVKGTHKEFIIRGKPAVCKYVLERLTSNDSSDGMYKILHEKQQANLIDVIVMKSELIKDNSNYSIPQKYHIDWKSYLQDLFSEPNTHDITFAGANYEKTRYWIFYSFEKGLKLKIHISGKPSFVAASINHLSMFGHKIIKFLD